MTSLLRFYLRISRYFPKRSCQPYPNSSWCNVWISLQIDSIWVCVWSLEPYHRHQGERKMPLGSAMLRAERNEEISYNILNNLIRNLMPAAVLLKIALINRTDPTRPMFVNTLRGVSSSHKGRFCRTGAKHRHCISHPFFQLHLFCQQEVVKMRLIGSFRHVVFSSHL